MTHRLKTLLVALILGLCPVVSLAPAYAACGSATGPAKDQVLQGIGETGDDCSGTGVTGIAKAAVNILSIVVGIAAIIVIVFAGFRYITSAGDTNKVGSAKNTLIYALIGLIIAALAQFLVHFVLNQADNATKKKTPSIFLVTPYSESQIPYDGSGNLDMLTQL